MNSNVNIFIGPTLYGLDQRCLTDAGLNIMPPVKRGDIEKLANCEEPSVAIIVDGTFHSYPSVSHMEINDAIKKGWEIWGLSSMGAIRASEMMPYGMHGFGMVYERYMSDMDFSDDEVTLIHDSDPPYTPLSIPMIQIRGFMKYLTSRGFISTNDSKEVLDGMKNTWYGNRTKFMLRGLLSKPMESRLVDDKLTLIGDFDIKQTDLLSFISMRPYTMELVNV